MDLQTLGRILLVIGIGIALVGGALLLLGRFFGLGSLPGDIRLEGPGFTCLIPIASMILISLLLTLVLNILIRILNRP